MTHVDTHNIDCPNNLNRFYFFARGGALTVVIILVMNVYFEGDY